MDKRKKNIDFTQIKSFYVSEENLKRVKSYLTEWEKKSHKSYIWKGSSRRYKGYFLLANRNNSHFTIFVYFMKLMTRWTWVWVDSGSWWWTGRPGVLPAMVWQTVGHDWATELNWTHHFSLFYREKEEVGRSSEEKSIGGKWEFRVMTGSHWPSSWSPHFL